MAQHIEVAEVRALLAAVNSYAGAYSELQNLQKGSAIIPEGDQKTGCIGEFFSYLFIRSSLAAAVLGYGNHSQKGWDIQVEDRDAVRRVQVKTASAFSKTRILSPIYPGWDELFVIYLSRSLTPEGFWIIDQPSIVAEGEVLRGCRCPDPVGGAPGSREKIPFGENRVKDLLGALAKFAPNQRLQRSATPRAEA